MSNMIKVGMADLKLCKAPDAITTLGLGSCVGIAIRDPITKIGGLAHIMLPDSTQFNGVVNRGTAHAKTFTVEHLLQLLTSEVPVDVHDAVQDGITLGGLAHVVCIKKLVEFFDNGVAAVSKIIDM